MLRGIKLATWMVCMALPSRAQQPARPILDSMIALLPAAKADTNKVMLFIHIMHESMGGRGPSDGLEHADQALALARQLHWERGEADVLGAIGRVHWKLGAFDTALSYHEQALAIAERIGDRKRSASLLTYIAQDHIDAGRVQEAERWLVRDLRLRHELGDKHGQAFVHNLLSYIHHEEGDLVAGVKDDLAALKLYEELNDRNGQAVTVANIGQTYLDLGKLEEARSYLLRAVGMHKRDGADGVNLSGALTHLGRLHLAMGDAAAADSTYREALRVAEGISDKGQIGLIRQALANIQMERGNYTEALKNLLFAAQNLEGSGFLKEDLAKTYADIGLCQTRLGHQAEARAYLDKAGGLAAQINSRSARSRYHRGMEFLDSTQGDWLSAYRQSKLHVAYTDSILSADNRDQIATAQVRFDYDKQMLADSLTYAADKAIQVREIQKQKVVRNAFIGGFAFVLLFAVVFLFQRNHISREKKRSEELLLNILPEEVARELKAKGEAEAVQIDQVTVLFTDFKGFTAMSEVMTPSQLVHDLHECFSAFDRIAEKYGIEKIKTIGDAYMAAGGLPTPNTTHAMDVIHAAFEMRDFITEGKARKIAAGLPYFEIRIGIHSGPVVAGIVGLKKFSYDIWGDTVNTASRMESSGDVGQVNISEATYALVKSEPALTFTPRGKVQAKGKGELEMYFVHRSAVGA
jgi:class 3 adenylate cyclase/Tfp pilus assembly protein PilF